MCEGEGLIWRARDARADARNGDRTGDVSFFSIWWGEGYVERCDMAGVVFLLLFLVFVGIGDGRRAARRRGNRTGVWQAMTGRGHTQRCKFNDNGDDDDDDEKQSTTRDTGGCRTRSNDKSKQRRRREEGQAT